MSKAGPNLYLIGFMGVGKGAVGRHAALQPGFQFIDSNHAIERAERCPFRSIFEAEGEANFRELERRFIES